MRNNEFLNLFVCLFGNKMSGIYYLKCCVYVSSSEFLLPCVFNVFLGDLWCVLTSHPHISSLDGANEQCFSLINL